MAATMATMATMNVVAVASPAPAVKSSFRRQRLIAGQQGVAARTPVLVVRPEDAQLFGADKGGWDNLDKAKSAAGSFTQNESNVHTRDPLARDDSSQGAYNGDDHPTLALAGSSSVVGQAPPPPGSEERPPPPSEDSPPSEDDSPPPPEDGPLPPPEGGPPPPPEGDSPPPPEEPATP